MIIEPNVKSNSEFKKLFKERLYKFTLQVMDYIDSMDNDKISWRLGDQLLRSCTSVIANYVEGQSASSTKELINYLNISLKSANESKLWFSLLKDSNRINATKYEPMMQELTEISKILASSIISLKSKSGISKTR
ncbi:MAG: four helix bundle protein [Cytophagales bacterium]|nr:four helix bundle protein [Cytophagales bacterium]